MNRSIGRSVGQSIGRLVNNTEDSIIYSNYIGQYTGFENNSIDSLDLFAHTRI